MIGRFDARILRACRTRGHWGPLERSFAAYSRAGDQSRLWLALGLAATATPARRAVGVRLILTVSAVEVINAAVKLCFRRPRPILDSLPPLCAVASQRSFPSAHAATSFAAARVLAGAGPPELPYAAAAAMTFSRLYLGVHHPSDVVAGALLGTAVAGLGGAAASLPRRRQVAGNP